MYNFYLILKLVVWPGLVRLALNYRIIKTMKRAVLFLSIRSANLDKPRGAPGRLKLFDRGSYVNRTTFVVLVQLIGSGKNSDQCKNAESLRDEVSSRKQRLITVQSEEPLVRETRATQFYGTMPRFISRVLNIFPFELARGSSLLFFLQRPSWQKKTLQPGFLCKLLHEEIIGGNAKSTMMQDSGI